MLGNGSLTENDQNQVLLPPCGNCFVFFCTFVCHFRSFLGLSSVGGPTILSPSPVPGAEI